MKATAMKQDANDIHRHFGPEALAEAIEMAEPGTTEDVAGPVPSGPDDADTDAPPKTGGVAPDDFRAYMPAHTYIFRPTGEMWAAGSVNARLGKMDLNGRKVPATAWLDEKRAVEQMTWAPGEPEEISDRLVKDGGWIDHNGVAVYNLYKPPLLVKPKHVNATPWRAHVDKVYGEYAEHIVKWCAHRVQFPGEKVNHALVLGGAQGIGKDSLLAPLKYAVAPWNFVEISPQHLLGRFNGFVKSVVLRISEARDLGEANRFAFYEHIKTYTTAPPEVFRCDEKNLKEHAVFNVCGVVLTTNHKTDGIFLPADDRRHYVAYSELTRDDFDENYWRKLYGWFEAGGNAHVAAYLAEYDLSGFDAKAPPPKTAAFWEMVDANRATDDSDLADALDILRHPDALTIEQVAVAAGGDFANWLTDKSNRRKVGHRFDSAGYVSVRYDGAKDGMWRIGGRRQAIYAKASLSLRDRYVAASTLTDIPV